MGIIHDVEGTRFSVELRTGSVGIGFDDPATDQYGPDDRIEVDYEHLDGLERAVRVAQQNRRDRKPPTNTTVETQDFIRRLVGMKDEAARLGLLKTMHAMDAATKEVGYEVAEQITGKPTRKFKASRRARR